MITLHDKVIRFVWFILNCWSLNIFFCLFITFQTWGSNFKRLVFIEKVISNLPCAKYFCFIFLSLFKFHINFGPAASHYWKHFFSLAWHEHYNTQIKCNKCLWWWPESNVIAYFCNTKIQSFGSSAFFSSKSDIFYWWSTSELISSQEGFVRDWYTNQDQRNRDIAIIWYCESCQDQ